ncbi:MAG: hypothetical protein K2J25_00455 [Oscillospiraceae bacterium]|nr:hypothetical protein [Oscillospiraceae bacterium]
MQENKKKSSGKEAILYIFESLIMLFDVIMSLGVFASGVVSAGIMFLVAAFVISPFCEKLLQKIPIVSVQNDRIKRVGIQIICSAVLFIIAVAVGALQMPTNTSKNETPVIETGIGQATSEEFTTETTEETKSTTTISIEVEIETTTTTTSAETETETTTIEITTETTTTTTKLETESTVTTTTTTKPETTTEVNAETTSDEDATNITLSHDTIAGILQLSLQEEIENSEVIYDEEEQAYVVSIWQDGLALSLSTMDSSSLEWKSIKESFVNGTDELLETVRELDPDAHLYFQILNDQNLERRLLRIYDGIVIYDVLEQ